MSLLDSIKIKDPTDADHKASSQTLAIMGEAKKRHNLYKNIQVKDMFERNPKAQFDGLAPRYNLPDTRPMLYKIHGQTSWSNNKSQKSTIIADIFKDAKHPQRQRPGVGYYQQHEAFKTTQMPNPTQYKFNKEKRDTLIDVIQAREKNMKGPADYSPERKFKVHGHYNTTVPIGGFMNETEYLSAQSPACVKYDVEAAKIKQKRRSPNASLVRDGKGPRPICLPYKKDDSPNPFTYKDVDTKWEKLSPHPSTQG